MPFVGPVCGCFIRCQQPSIVDGEGPVWRSYDRCRCNAAAYPGIDPECGKGQLSSSVDEVSMRAYRCRYTGVMPAQKPMPDIRIFASRCCTGRKLLHRSTDDESNSDSFRWLTASKSISIESGYRSGWIFVSRYLWMKFVLKCRTKKAQACEFLPF
jgi:hypothetical protein